MMRKNSFFALLLLFNCGCFKSESWQYGKDENGSNNVQSPITNNRISITEFRNSYFEIVKDYYAVKDFLDSGGDVNAPDAFGFLILQIAASKGKRDVIDLLISRGADINCLGPKKITPLSLAIGSNSKNVKREELAKYLIGKGARVNIKGEINPPLNMAAKEGESGIIELLVAKEADLNSKDYKGNSPLHKASSVKNIQDESMKIIEFLISRGAEVNSLNRDRKTPLDVAESKDIAELLRKHGAKSGEETVDPKSK